MTKLINKAKAIIFLLVIIVFIPIFPHPFLIPKLFLISLLALLYWDKLKLLNIYFLIIYLLVTVYFFISPTYSGVFFLIELLLYYFLFLVFLSEDIPEKMFSWGTLIVSLYAILQYFHIDLRMWGGNWGIKHVFSTIGNPNLLGIYLVSFLSFQLFTKGIKKDIFSILTIIISFTALLMTLSKGALFSFIIIFFIFLLKNIKAKKIAFFSLSLIIFISIFFINSEYNSRYHIFRVDALTIKEHILGTGLATFPVNYKNNMARYLEKNPKKNTAKIFVKRAHSELLQMGVELGILGVLLYILLFIIFSFLAIEKGNYPILAIVFFSLYDFPFHDALIVFIFVIFLGQLLKGKLKFKKITFLPLLLIIIFLANLTQLIGEFAHKNFIFERHLDYFSRARSEFYKGTYEQALSNINRALKGDIYPEYLNLKADIYYSMDNIDRTFENLTLSEKMVPENLKTKRKIIFYYRKLENWGKIEKEYKKILNYEKNDMNYYSYAVAAFKSQDFANGINALNNIKGFYENVAFAQLNLGNFDYLMCFAKDKKSEEEFNKYILIKKALIPIPKQKLSFSALNKKSYSLNDLKHPLPFLINNEDTNIFNPSYYIEQAFKSNSLLPNKNILFILKKYFYGFEFLNTSLYILYNYKDVPNVKKMDNSVYKDISFDELPK
ncbi:O-antigen ligase family protein [bacterium]|nr:O-antigen ligase family protein [bacterium]